MRVQGTAARPGHWLTQSSTSGLTFEISWSNAHAELNSISQMRKQGGKD